MSAFYPIMLAYASIDIEARINGHRSKDKCPQKLASMLSSSIWGNCGHLSKIFLKSDTCCLNVPAPSGRFDLLFLFRESLMNE